MRARCAASPAEDVDAAEVGGRADGAEGPLRLVLAEPVARNLVGIIAALGEWGVDHYLEKSVDQWKF